MTRLSGCVLGLGLCTGIASASRGEALEELFLRGHPLLVHFPIALLLVAVLFEAGHLVVGRKNEHRRAISGAGLGLLALGAISAGLSAWSGWENAGHNPPTSSVADLVYLHRWLGISVASVSGLALLFGLAGWRGGKKRVGIYRTLLLVGAGLVGVTGHYGGSIVRGESYLTGPLNDVLFGSDDEEGEDEEVVLEDGNETVVPEAVQRPSAEVIRASFERDVQPIFEARCIMCHGLDEAAGRLRLHSWEEIERLIDDRDDLIVSGLPDQSEIFHRVSLDAGNIDLMPADDTGRLDDAQIDSIRAWIESLDPGAVDSGADSSGDGADGAADGAIQLEEDARASVERTMEQVRLAGGYASRVSLSDDSVVVNLSMLGEKIDDTSLELLAGLEESLVDLDLGGTAVGDVGASMLASFGRLQRLDLSKTRVSNAGVGSLVGLEELVSLNLYGTAVDDEAVESLIALSGLKSLFLWDSAFSGDGVAAVRAGLAGCTVDFGEVGVVDPVDEDEGG